MSARIWLIRRFGIRCYWRFARARRAGVVIDYSRVFTPYELAFLEEHMESVPWREIE